jgi:predicted GH43/DUF377 family glycosyl hydrolase
MTEMSIAYSTDPVHWTNTLDDPILTSRPKMFDSHVVEPGPVPLISEGAIFLIYDGGDDNKVDRTGCVRFDKSDPTKVLGWLRSRSLSRRTTGNRRARFPT